MLSNVSCTISIFSLIHGSHASTTWRRRSASMESSSVDRKAAISSGGRSRINPIVSLISTSSHIQSSSSAGIYILPTFVPSVAKSLFSASTHFFVSAFMSVDFPALVYQTIPTVANPFLFLHSR